MTTESDKNSDTRPSVPGISHFEKMDYFSSALKGDAKKLGGIVAFSSIVYTVLGGFGAFTTKMSSSFDLSRIPLWVLICGPLVCIASLAVSYWLCVVVDQKNAEIKSAYRKQLNVIAIQTGLQIDDSGSEPRLRRVLQP